MAKTKEQCTQETQQLLNQQFEFEKAANDAKRQSKDIAKELKLCTENICNLEKAINSLEKHPDGETHYQWSGENCKYYHMKDISDYKTKLTLMEVEKKKLEEQLDIKKEFKSKALKQQANIRARIKRIRWPE